MNGNRSYAVTLKFSTPLIMHSDNLDWADDLKEWRTNPDNQGVSVPGDDRSPGWTWLGSLYHDGHIAAMPNDNLMAALLEGGASVPTGKGKKTFKAQTQSGMMSPDLYWPLRLPDGKTVPIDSLMALRNGDVRSFKENMAAARAVGFDLLAKRVKIGNSKHVRVRPIFPSGSSISGRLTVWDEQLTGDILGRIIKQAGTYVGLGDWRPKSPRKPGPYGMFTYELNGLDLKQAA